MIFAGICLDTVLHLNYNDFPYGVRMSHIWIISENAVALIVSSSIYLRPMFDRAFSRCETALRPEPESQSQSQSHPQSKWPQQRIIRQERSGCRAFGPGNLCEPPRNGGGG
jgi:hypothetical protein